jgi:Mce-associated membrane protein
VEDQPADAGDLTERAAEAAEGVSQEPEAVAGAPAGGGEAPEGGGDAERGGTEAAEANSGAPARKGGRHRWFRPRPVAAIVDGKTEESAEAETRAAEADAGERVAEAGEGIAEADAGEGIAEADAGEGIAEADAGEGIAEADAGEGIAEADAGETERTEAGETAAVGDEKAGAAGETTKPAGKRGGRAVAAAVVIAAVVFVGAGSFAGAMTQPYLADRALVNTKLDIARTAANAITTLWTYTPEDMDSLPDRAARYLSGDFEDQYRKYIDAIAPVNKQAKVSNSTEVVGAAVESLNRGDATAVVYTNTTNTSPQSNNLPSLLYVSYRLTMERHASRWLITKMTPITTVNVTPRLG